MRATSFGLGSAIRPCSNFNFPSNRLSPRPNAWLDHLRLPLGDLEEGCLPPGSFPRASRKALDERRPHVPRARHPRVPDDGMDHSLDLEEPVPE